MSYTRTLKEMLLDARLASAYQGGAVEAIVRRAAEVARHYLEECGANSCVCESDGAADAILADAGLRDE